MGGAKKMVFEEDGPKHMIMRSGSTGIEVDWGNHEHRRCVTACLVRGTYVMEHDRTTGQENSPRSLAPAWWESFHFQRRRNYELEFACDCDLEFACGDCKLNFEARCRWPIYGAVFEYAPPDGEPRHPSAPSYIIAFRGTMPRDPAFFSDMLDNFSILLNKQHLCGRFRHAREKVGELLLSLRSIPGNGNGGAVWLAGHSLGASIALDVGRDLMSTRGLNLPTFLFNPPHVSLAPVISEEARRDVYTMGYIGKRLLGKALPRHKDHMDDLFRKLSPWEPNLYVHPEDAICKGFIDYFEQRERMQKRHPCLASAASLSYRDMLLGKQRVRPHLLPSAMVWKNRSRHGDGHGLCQWWEPEGSEKLVLSPKRYTWP
ncbi:GDSL esterase/lipase [Panicum miliaceum]|uniref:GDSL esterase/lipase n=1 Tax=Panicum miliaceum TaxID=4540 RepID=A0A3L6T7U9_PANMI|nr:GDSL esterase/lipase [Panicum miliaceum]